MLALLLLLATTQPTTASSFPVDSPRAAVESLTHALADGDASTIRTLLSTSTPAQEHMRSAMIQMSQAIAHLRPVAIKRYGEVPARSVTGDTDLSTSDEHAKLDSAFQSIEGDTAHITFADPANDPITLHRAKDHWTIPLSTKTASLSDEDLESRAADLSASAAVIEQVTTECAAGHWQTANDVALAIQSRIQKRLTPATAPTTASSSTDSAPSHTTTQTAPHTP